MPDFSEAAQLGVFHDGLVLQKGDWFSMYFSQQGWKGAVIPDTFSMSMDSIYTRAGIDKKIYNWYGAIVYNTEYEGQVMPYPLIVGRAR